MIIPNRRVFQWESIENHRGSLHAKVFFLCTFPTLSLVSYVSPSSVIINQEEERVYQDCILYVRTRIHGQQRLENKLEGGSEYLSPRGPELLCCRGISGEISGE